MEINIKTNEMKLTLSDVIDSLEQLKKGIDEVEELVERVRRENGNIK